MWDCLYRRKYGKKLLLFLYQLKKVMMVKQLQKD